MLLLIVLFLITSCGQKNIHKQIKSQLDDAFLAEEDFIEYQQQLLQLEQRDLEIYDKIVQLDDSAVSELQQLIGEALQITEQRDAYLQAERKAMKESKTTFVQIEPLIGEISEEEIRETVEKLYETMHGRYETYEEVYETYITSLQLTEILYEQLSDLHTHDLLYDTIEEVNETYEQLIRTNEQFNRLTKKYNHLKTEYYNLIWE